MATTPQTSEEQENIERAIEIVGFSSPGNTSLKFDKFDEAHIKPLECFLPKTRALVDILGSEPVREATRTYLANSKPANEAQSRYRRRRLTVAMLLGLGLIVCIGIAFRLPDYLARQYLLALQFVSWIAADPQLIDTESAAIAAKLYSFAPWVVLIALALPPLVVRILKPNDYYELWQKSRAKTEAFRVEHFKRVFSAASCSPGADTSSLLSLKLEYFRRWQIDTQKAYFNTKHKEHQSRINSANRNQRLVGIILGFWGLLLVGGAVGSLDEQGPLPLIGAGNQTATWLTAKLQLGERYEFDQKFLLVGLAMAVVWTAIGYHAYLSASNRNAARFRVMEKNFEEIERLLPAIRLAAARNNEAMVLGFVDRIHSTMSLELADWVRLAELDQGKDEGLFLAAPASEFPK